MQNDPEYQAYMREVQSYLKKVKGGRRVPAADPTAPQYSQAADDERQARKAGLGKHITFGPPTPAWQPPQLQQQQMTQPAPPPVGIMDRLDQFRGDLTKRFSSRNAAPTLWGFHEPTVTAGAGVEAGLEGAGKVLADPRNAWMGLGPMAVIRNPMQAFNLLKRYHEMGGTPQTLNRVLTNRAIDPVDRNTIVRGFRAGTDIAAPTEATSKQFSALGEAADTYNNLGHWGSTNPTFNRNSINIRSGRERAEEMAKMFPDQVIESGTKGNAAYDAVSRQAGRVMDQPEFNLRRPSYGPIPLQDVSQLNQVDRGRVTAGQFGRLFRMPDEGAYWRDMERDQRRARGMAPPDER